MLGFDPRAARIAWTVALVALAIAVTYAVRHTAFVFVLALFFAYMVYPLVERISGWAPPRWPDSIATAVVFGLLLLGLIGIAALVGPPIIDQAAALSEQLPKLTDGTKVLDRLPLPDWLSSYRGRLTEFARDHLQSGAAYAVPIARQLGKALLSVAGNLIYIILIPVLAFLLIKDGSSMRNRYLAWTDRRANAPMWRHIVNDLDTLLGGYMRALLILALVTVIVYSAVFTIAGVPYGLLLAVLSGVLEFVPVLGPLAAAVICASVAGLAGYDHVLGILGFIVLYRIFQDYVLNPYLMSERVTVPPILVLFGLLAGEEIAGVVGVFLSVPVLATAKIAVNRIAEEWQRRELLAAAASSVMPLAVPVAVPVPVKAGASSAAPGADGSIRSAGGAQAG